MSTITPITPNIPLPAAQAGFTPRESREQQLRVDQVVRATVSEGGHERVWLNIGRQRFLAKTEIPLKTGMNLTLLVSRTSPRLEFQVLADPLDSRIRQKLHLLEGPWSLDGLSALMSDPEVSSPGSREVWARFLELRGAADQAVAGELARLSARLGLDYEALLAQGQAAGAATTLKRLLEDARKSGNRPEKESSCEKIESFSGLFELWQLIRLKLAQRSVEFQPLPLPRIEQGFLLAERGEGAVPDDKGKDERSWRVTVHLQMSGIGPLQVDFLWERSGLFLRFHCATQAQASFLSGRRAELGRSVTALPLKGAAFSVGAPAPATVLAQLLAGDGVLDERV
ncbi:MAG: hypothetical protein L3J03_01580 [Desulfobacterales bacterium]|nr:hypothetical protein [Desulfobacterales bacterium]